MTSNDTPAMQRYIERSDATSEAFQSALNREQALKDGPMQWMTGLDADFRGVCIATRR